jgi:hypothetical protein
VTGPGWLAGTLAAVMLSVAAYTPGVLIRVHRGTGGTNVCRSTEASTTRRGTAAPQLRVDDVVGVRGTPG